MPLATLFLDTISDYSCSLVNRSAKCFCISSDSSKKWMPISYFLKNTSASTLSFSKSCAISFLSSSDLFWQTDSLMSKGESLVPMAQTRQHWFSQASLIQLCACCCQLSLEMSTMKRAAELLRKKAWRRCLWNLEQLLEQSQSWISMRAYLVSRWQRETSNSSVGVSSQSESVRWRMRKVLPAPGSPITQIFMLRMRLLLLASPCCQFITGESWDGYVRYQIQELSYVQLRLVMVSYCQQTASAVCSTLMLQLAAVAGHPVI